MSRNKKDFDNYEVHIITRGNFLRAIFPVLRKKLAWIIGCSEEKVSGAMVRRYIDAYPENNQ